MRKIEFARARLRDKNMRAIVLHHELDVMGGAERVFLAVLEALHEMGIKVILITKYKPRLQFNIDKVSYIFPYHVKKWPIHLRILLALQVLPLCFIHKADLVIATSGVGLPYLSTIFPCFSCSGPPHILYIHGIGNPPSIREYLLKFRRSVLWKLYFASYYLLFGLICSYLKRYAITKSLVLTNSKFTKGHLKDLYPKVKPIVVRPPVDVELFTSVLGSMRRENRVLTIARINPGKKIENVIKLAKLLPGHIKCTIIGSLHNRDINYYKKLVEMIKDYKLEERVDFKTNLPTSELYDLMARSKIYFNSRPETFGISIVEAMAAGIIPIVPDYGGQTEFVPKKYQYHTIDEAASAIVENINASERERVVISNIARQFSKERFKSKIKAIVSSVIN